MTNCYALVLESKTTTAATGARTQLGQQSFYVAVSVVSHALPSDDLKQQTSKPDQENMMIASSTVSVSVFGMLSLYIMLHHTGDAVGCCSRNAHNTFATRVLYAVGCGYSTASSYRTAPL